MAGSDPDILAVRLRESMKMKTRRRSFVVALPLVALVISGCRAVLGTAVIGTAVVVGTVGLAGYGVYKSGEAVVSTVGSVGSTVGSTVGSVGSSTKQAAANKHQSVVVSRGTLKVQANHSITELYPAAEWVFEGAGFTEVEGRHDALAAVLIGKTAFKHDVTVILKLVKQDVTAVSIRIGGGNLEQSQYLYQQMLATVAKGIPEEES